MLLIQGGEGLGHVDAVQPDLIGVNLLVPEAALPRAGLRFQLPPQKIGGFFVLFLACFFKQREQHPAFVHIVQRVAFGFVGADSAVVIHKGINEGFGKIEVPLIAGDFRHGQQGRHHAAVDVIPIGGFPLPDLFHVPGGIFGRRLLDQSQHVAVDFFIHSGSFLLHLIFPADAFASLTMRLPRRLHPRNSISHAIVNTPNRMGSTPRGTVSFAPDRLISTVFTAL